MLFRNSYRSGSTRMQNWDYSWNGSYFITIVTFKHMPLFGKIIDAKMQYSDLGTIAYSCWNMIESHFDSVYTESFIVMPNHVHGIITIDNPYAQIEQNDIKSPGERRFQNQGSHSLSSIVGSYKSAVTREIHNQHSWFQWQGRFHDHLIRDEHEFRRIDNYIRTNPLRWNDDCFNRPPGLEF